MTRCAERTTVAVEASGEIVIEHAWLGLHGVLRYQIEADEGDRYSNALSAIVEGYCPPEPGIQPSRLHRVLDDRSEEWLACDHDIWWRLVLRTAP
jgi:hypothetical protein